MTASFPSAARRWRSAAAALRDVGRRTVVESVYLLTAPVLAAAGLLLVLGGLFVGALRSLLRGGAPVPPGSLAPARWCADVEWWRITTVRPTTAGGPGTRSRPKETVGSSDPGLWLDVAHAVVVLPVAVVTAVVTALWWFVGLGGATSALRGQFTAAESLPPLTLNAGTAQSHMYVSLGLTSPAGRVTFGTTLGLLLLVALPLVTRACVTVQAGLGQRLLSDASPLRRRISGLEHERDIARAQTVAVVTAEATALRRLERDIHDGLQQRLVRLAMELGRAQHHFDTKPQAAREALADAVIQTQEALDELRVLSRGIAPPILVDRGLREALTVLAARSTIPVELDADFLECRPNVATETAAYFTSAEALTNVAKHSHADRCAIGLRHSDGTLRAWVTDDGVGGAALEKGHGLRGLDDRLTAAGGRLLVTSPDGGPTTITAEFPCC